MKIMIIGYSGSGKSTLAMKLGKLLNIKTFYLDKIQFKSNFVVREKDEKIKLVNNILDNNENWIIDGNYRKLEYVRRLHEADLIIFMNFNRFNSLYRVIKRNIEYKGKSRPSITKGCNERLDFEFLTWILFNGRNKEKRRNYKKICSEYETKVRVIKNQKQLDEFLLIQDK